MRQVFISYARDDRPQVEELAARLRRLVDSVWFDSQLHGGEDWWAGILDRIRACDVFLAVVSSASLDSEACRIERKYAASVNRTIVPVALQTLPPALPGDIAALQIVNFSTPGEQSLSDLARALLAAPDPEPLPDPLPDDPPAPLSYLTDLVDLVSSPRELTKSEQMDILMQLERGLGSADHDERQGARQVLLSMKQRDDLATSVEKTIDLLARDQIPLIEPVTAETDHHEPPATPAPASQPAAPPGPPEASGFTGEAPHPTHTDPSVPASQGQAPARLRGVIIAVVAVAIVALAGIAWALVRSGGEDGTADVVSVPPPATDPVDPADPGDNNHQDDDGNGAPPSLTPTDPCRPAPTSFPGEVVWRQKSPAALAWQRLLVSKGTFNDHPDNCDGNYDGDKQKDVVEALRESLGLPAADGLLDKKLYDCLVHNECPDGPGCTLIEVPNVVGFDVIEAEDVLTRAGFAVQPQATDRGPTGSVQEQNPEGGSDACRGETVTITVRLSTPEPTRGA